MALSRVLIVCLRAAILLGHKELGDARYSVRVTANHPAPRSALPHLAAKWTSQNRGDETADRGGGYGALAR